MAIPSWKEETVEEHKVGPLVGSIIADVQALVRKELALARNEFVEELKRARTAAYLASAGFIAAGVAAILFGFVVAQVLVEITSLPVWACTAIAAILFTAAAVGFLSKGKSTAEKFDPIPHETVQNVKENVQWIKNQT